MPNQHETTPYPPRRFYDQQRANVYAARSPRRHQAETALLERGLKDIAGGQVLDVPCGTGRLDETLARLGCSLTRADFSMPMLKLAGGGVCADAAHLPFRNRSFELVVCHRFLHHLAPSEVERVLAELARVTKHHLAITFFHPISLHALTRRCKCLLRGKKSGRHAITPGRLRLLLAQQGFEVHGFQAQSAYLRELWLGVFTRK